MSGLQEAFYIMGIIFMSVMLILIIALVVAVFAIKKRVNRIQHTIEEKINTVTMIAERGGEIAAGVTGAAKRALGRK